MKKTVFQHVGLHGLLCLVALPCIAHAQTANCQPGDSDCESIELLRPSLLKSAESAYQLSTPLLVSVTQGTRYQMNSVQERLHSLRISQQQPGGAQPLQSYGWAGGETFTRDLTDNTLPAYQLHTQNVTLGADKRLDAKWLFGGAVSWTGSRNRFDDNTTSRQHSRGNGATAYANWNVLPEAYLSATVSYEQNHFTLERDGGVDELSRSQPRGKALGMGLAGGYDFSFGAWTLSPHVRLDRVNTHIAAFDEYDGLDAMSLSGQRFHSTTASAGAIVQYSMTQKWGVLRPYARLEFTHRTDKMAQTASTRLPLLDTVLPVRAELDNSQNHGAWGLGMNATTPYGFNVFVDYQSTFSLKNYRVRNLTAGMRVEM